MPNPLYSKKINYKYYSNYRYTMNTKEIQILQTILKQRDDLKSKLGGKHDKLVQARIYENEKLGKQIAEVMIQKENLPQ